MTVLMDSTDDGRQELEKMGKVKLQGRSNNEENEDCFVLWVVFTTPSLLVIKDDSRNLIATGSCNSVKISTYRIIFFTTG